MDPRKITIVLSTFVAAVVLIGPSGKVQGQENETNSPPAVERSTPRSDASIKLDLDGVCQLWSSGQEYEEFLRLNTKDQADANSGGLQGVPDNKVPSFEYMEKHAANLFPAATLRFVKNHVLKPLGWDVIVEQFDPNSASFPRENIKRGEPMFLPQHELPNAIALPFHHQEVPLGPPLGLVPTRLRIGIIGNKLTLPPPGTMKTMKIVDIDWGPFIKHFGILGWRTVDDTMQEAFGGGIFKQRYLLIETVCIVPTSLPDGAFEPHFYNRSGIEMNPRVWDKEFVYEKMKCQCFPQAKQGERYDFRIPMPPDGPRLESIRNIKIAYDENWFGRP